MIKVENLCKTYGNFSLKNVSFQVEKGFITGFIGQNGAGKTTVIKSILNLIGIGSGKITVMGMDSVQDSAAIKNRVGVVLDDGVFYNHLTLREMKGVLSSFYDQWDEAVYQSYIQRFQLDESKRIQDLSKGMRMKYSLAIAFSHNADVLIMDEPTSGLDPIVREEMLDVLQDIIQDGEKSIFFSTHITADLEKVADYLIFIENGEIILNGAKDEILESHAILKGGKEDLTAEIKEKSIYIYQREYSFEAMVRRQDIDFEDQALPWERPNIEDIMRFYVKAQGGNLL